jgi:outer membrane protein assembly factor BamB
MIPMTAGINADSEVDVELSRMLDNLRFMCMGPDGLIVEKYEHYKEQLLKQYSSEDLDDEVVLESDIKEPITTVEQPSIPIASSGPMDSAWSMKSHDLHHTGRSPYSTTDNPYDEKWRFESDDWIQEGIAIDDDGILYFGDFDSYIYAVYPDGTLKWRIRAEGWIDSTPALAEDGTIYVGSWDTGLYAINPDGTEIWRFGSGGSIASSPAIGQDGTIYCGHTQGDIFAMYPNGTRKWRYKTGDGIYSHPAIGDDGTIYCGSDDKYLYALNPNGTLKWRFKTGAELGIGGAPSIADDGTVYIAGTWDNYLYALNPNGTIKWKCDIIVSCSNPSIDNNGTIYVGGDEKLYAVYPNGTLKWSCFLGNGRWVSSGSAPAISADGTIYVGTNIGSGVEGGDIIAVNSNGTIRFRKKIANRWIDSSPSIAEDGTVYIGTANEGADYLYAFGVAELEVDANGPHYGLVNEPMQFTGTSSGGYQPHRYLWEFGDTQTSEEQNPIHTYTSPDNYDVVLTVTDDKSNTEIDTTFAWIQESNTAPDKPTINGPIQGTVGVTYDYTFSATDPDDSIVYIYVHWGDGSDTGWKGPYDSGQEVTFSHKWTTENTFTINAQAKDPYDAEGPWETLDVTIPRDKSTSNVLFRLMERFPMLQKLLLFISYNIKI